MRDWTDDHYREAGFAAVARREGIAVSGVQRPAEPAALADYLRQELGRGLTVTILPVVPA